MTDKQKAPSKWMGRLRQLRVRLDLTVWAGRLRVRPGYDIVIWERDVSPIAAAYLSSWDRATELAPIKPCYFAFAANRCGNLCSIHRLTIPKAEHANPIARWITTHNSSKSASATDSRRRSRKTVTATFGRLYIVYIHIWRLSIPRCPLRFIRFD